MVTQPIQSKKLVATPNAIPAEVASGRMLIEATLHQVIPTQVLAANSLRLGTTEALFSSTSRSAGFQSVLDQSHPACERYRELERRRALETAIERTDVKRLYLAANKAEIETPHRLFFSLRQLRGQAPSGCELGITISLPTDVDILRITELYREAQEHDLRIAFDDFQGNGAQVLHLKSVLPDYLVLSATMMNNLTTMRQPLRRLESMLTACEELAIKPVLPPTDSEHTLALCQEIGFDLVLTSSSRAVAKSRAELSLTV
jgi:hypothetical protein